MSTRRNPWFHIVHALGNIQELCRKAEKAERTRQEAEKARQEASKTPGLTLPTPQGTAGADVLALKKALREQLSTLKAKLAESLLPEADTFHVLFPLTIYTDELARSAIHGRGDAWQPPLQRERFDFDDGGVRFYTHIDALFEREKTQPIQPLILETFYLCLEAGFLGQYRDNPAKIGEYKDNLKARISKARQEARTSKDSLSNWDDSSVELVRFPVRYYLWAAAAVVGGVLLLNFARIVETLSAG